MRTSSSARITTAAVAAAISLFVLIICGGSRASASPARGSSSGAAVTAADRTEALQIFKTRCAVCHGQEGRGNGPASVALNPKPQDYHNQAWQKATSDATIEKAIVEGGTAVGKSAAMAPNPDLKDKPGVVVALKDIIRKLGQEK
ncbi:MAG: c-type cytochrome [Acidobacteriota bacterium]